MRPWFVQNRETALYRAASVRRLDDQAISGAISGAGISGLELMHRAGVGAWRVLRQHWPQARSITVLCGPGNNGGDGLVLARLAAAGGLRVRTLMLGDPNQLSGDAASCYREFVESDLGLKLESFDPLQPLLPITDGVVDALYGTGLSRAVTGAGADLIRAINDHPGFRLSLDIPSGLHADTGKVQGCAVCADVTVTFIGMKQGLFTADARQQCGELVFEDLDVPAGVYQEVAADAWRVSLPGLRGLLGRRERGAHKGRYGHVLVIGGEKGYAGAPALCARAAARSGAGLVSVASRAAHLAVINALCPELMFCDAEVAEDIGSLLSRVSVVAIGPGLGRSYWSRELLQAVLTSPVKRLVLDADALNLLAEDPELMGSLRTHDGEVVCTPHPGEASRLLVKDLHALEADRFAACQALQDKLGGTVILKGPGSLIQSAQQRPWICEGGNPGMASGGMGDVLSGVIAALMAQGLDAERAAVAGCVVHAAAADEAVLTGGGERGLLASDLMAPLQRLVNQL